MKNLTAKQLDAKFAKAAKLAEQLARTLHEIDLGCESWQWGVGNSTGLMQRTRWTAEVLQNERDMHKSNYERRLQNK